MKVKIVNLTLDYKNAIQQLADNINIAKSLRAGFPNPYTLADAENFIRSVKNDNSKRVFAILYDNEFCGAIGLHNLDLKNKDNIAEIGYWLGEPFWGKGITSEAIELIAKFAKENLPVKGIEAFSLENNIGSYKALEKNGFQFVKKVDKDCNQIQKGVKSLYYQLLFQ